MKKAFLVISEFDKKLVDVEDVDHSKYKNIFQCPHCSATLLYRDGFRRNGHWVRASFVHPEGDLTDCDLRVAITFDKTRSDHEIFNNLERGQSSKKLEKAFMKCLLSYLLDRNPSILSKYQESSVFRFRWRDELFFNRKINYNKQNVKSFLDPELIIDVSSIILKSNYFSTFLFSAPKVIKKFILDNQNCIDYFLDREKDRGTNRSLDDNINDHCWQIMGICKYLRIGSSEVMRQKFLEMMIFGNSRLPVQYKYFMTTREIKDIENVINKTLIDDITVIENERESQLKILKSFDHKVLEDIYNNHKNLDFNFLFSNAAIGNDLPKFVLDIIVNIFYYDWSILPEFYY